MSSEHELALTQQVENLPTFDFTHRASPSFETAFDFARVPGIDGAMYALRLGGGNWGVVRFETVCVVESTKGVPGKRLPGSYVLRSPQLTGSDSQMTWGGVLCAVKSIETRWGETSSGLTKRLDDGEEGIRVRAVSDLYRDKMVKGCSHGP